MGSGCGGSVRREAGDWGLRVVGKGGSLWERKRLALGGEGCETGGSQTCPGMGFPPKECGLGGGGCAPLWQGGVGGKR